MGSPPLQLNELVVFGDSAGAIEDDVASNRAIGIMTDGAARVNNLAEWGRHIVDSLSGMAVRSPDPRLDTFIAELKSYVPKADPGPEHLGFAVPLRLQTNEGELHLISTLTPISTAGRVAPRSVPPGRRAHRHDPPIPRHLLSQVDEAAELWVLGAKSE